MRMPHDSPPHPWRLTLIQFGLSIPILLTLPVMVALSTRFEPANEGCVCVTLAASDSARSGPEPAFRALPHPQYWRAKALGGNPCDTPTLPGLPQSLQTRPPRRCV